MKKAFTLIELMFSLLIISIVISFAIIYYPNDKEVSDTSLRNDAQLIINEVLTYYNTNNCFPNIDNSKIITGSTGEVKDSLGNTFYYALSKDNHLLIKSIECDDKTNGFALNIYNDISEKEIQFNYCVEKIFRRVEPTIKGSYLNAFTVKDFCVAN